MPMKTMFEVRLNISREPEWSVIFSRPPICPGGRFPIVVNYGREVIKGRNSSETVRSKIGNHRGLAIKTWQLCNDAQQNLYWDPVFASQVGRKCRCVILIRQKWFMLVNLVSFWKRAAVGRSSERQFLVCVCCWCCCCFRSVYSYSSICDVIYQSCFVFLFQDHDAY